MTMTNDEIARQHFEHFNPEFQPVKRWEFDELKAQMNALRIQIELIAKSLERNHK